MLKDRYNTFEDWHKDYMIFKDNPNDTNLLDVIEKRTNNSGRDVKEQVRVYIQSEALEFNPFLVLESIGKQLGPGYTVVVKSHDDPWFEA